MVGGCRLARSAAWLRMERAARERGGVSSSRSSRGLVVAGAEATDRPRQGSLGRLLLSFTLLYVFVFFIFFYLFLLFLFPLLIPQQLGIPSYVDHAPSRHPCVTWKSPRGRCGDETDAIMPRVGKGGEGRGSDKH